MHPSHAAELAAPHYHFTIFAFFVIGYFLHVWLQTSSIANAHPDPAINTAFVVGQNAPRLAWRFFISLLFFLGVWANPSWLPAVISLIPSITLSDNMIALLSMPMNIIIAGGMGVFNDVVLGFIPVLKNYMPAIETTETKRTVKVTEETTVTQTAKPTQPEVPLKS